MLYNESTTLQCVAMGLPEVSYEWRRGMMGGVTEPVLLGGRVSVSEGNLTITFLQREDGGVYFCNASNQLGSIQAVANVVVLGRCG